MNMKDNVTLSAKARESSNFNQFSKAEGPFRSHWVFGPLTAVLMAL